jgi:hypothetical protein
VLSYPYAANSLIVNRNANVLGTITYVTDFVVTSGGNVGVGTASPSVQFDIESSSSPAFKLTDGTQANGYLLESDASGNAKWVNPLWSLSGSNIHNTNSGNVGIGTSSPVVALDVQGGVVRIGSVSNSNDWSSTNTSGYSLYVQGGVLAEKFKCALSTTSDWSDYVLDKGYKLKPLSEVETYISQNHHLPGVPSAEDVKCDGIDMADMDATLLKKIEELTLYMLKQQKEIESLRTQLPITK